MGAKCPVCKCQANLDRTSGDRYAVKCRRCGRFAISGTLYATIDDSPPDYDVSAALRHRQEADPRTLLTVTSDVYGSLASSVPPKTDVAGKMRYLLRYVADKSSHPGTAASLHHEDDCWVCYATNAKGLSYYLSYARDLGYLTFSGSGPHYLVELSPKGWEEVARSRTIESPNAFVAMCFTEKVPHGLLLAKAYSDAIKPGIQDAHYHPVRIDKEPFNGDIVFEIIARIKESRFVVSDVTEHRNGVYFEGGYAMGMGLPVIWLCHEEDLKKCHFDTEHFNHIVWTDPAKLREALTNRILATIGKGPLRRVTSP